MILAAFLTGVVAGIVIGGAAAFYQIGKAKAAERAAMDLVNARHALTLSPEDLIRRAGC